MSLHGKLLKHGIDLLPGVRNDIAIYKGHIRINGRDMTPDTTAIKVLIYDGSEDVLIATGTTVPTDAETGFAKGCIFIKTDAVSEDRGLYENIGTSTSCLFDAIGAITPEEHILTDANIVIGDATGRGAEHPVTGDITMSRGGVTAISTGVIVDADINANAAITVTKLADGSVSNVEFQYINSLTSNAQTQLNSLDNRLTTTESDITSIETLADGKIYIGNASNTLSEVTLSGDLTVSNAGVVTLANQTQPAPTAKTVAVTLTGAELLTKIITGTHTAGATQAYTLPTGADMDTALGTFVVDDSFDFTIINLSTTLADTITLTASTGFTIVGNAVIESAHADSEWMSSGTFRVRKTLADTFVCYRLS